LPGRSGAECRKNIDSTAAAMVASKNASWTPALLVPMMGSRRACTALAYFCGACLQLLEESLWQLRERGLEQAIFV
jgi:hypothetical protein